MRNEEFNAKSNESLEQFKFSMRKETIDEDDSSPFSCFSFLCSFIS